MALNNYNNLLNSGRCSTKDPKDSHILALVVLAQNISDDFNKSSDKSNTSNRETTNGVPAYIRDLPPWILGEPKGVMGNKNKYIKEYW